MNSKVASEDFKIRLLSVIMPVYKEGKTIQKNLQYVINLLDSLPYKYELIPVIDGEVDNSRQMAEKVAKKYPGRVRVEGYIMNLGKGHAVRYGMARAKGDVIGFVDTGYDLNLNGLPLLLEHMKWYHADIIIASKRHPASKVVYPRIRRIISYGYQMGVKILFGLKIRDTQVGMKFFKREVLEEVLPRLLVKEYAFDIEILAVANHLGFKKIYEAPVELAFDFGHLSTVVSKGFLRTIFKMLKDTSAVFYRLRILHYYDSKNRKKWITPEYLTLQKK